MLPNSSIMDLDSTEMNLSRKASAARSREGGRHAVSKFRRAVKVKITIKDRRRNLAAEFEREKIVSERRKADETKSLKLHSVQESCVRGNPPPPLIRVMRTPYEGGQGPCTDMDINCAGERNWRR